MKMDFDKYLEALSMIKEQMTYDQYRSILANIYLTKIVADFEHCGQQYNRQTVLHLVNNQLRTKGVAPVSYYFLRGKC